MYKLIYLSILIPQITLASICLKNDPLVNQYNSQKNWKKETITQAGVSHAVNGYTDLMDNFFPEADSAKIFQKTLVSAAPGNQDASAFYRFCKDYKKKGSLLTTFRKSQSMNQYNIKLRYLPSSEDYNNDPYEKLKTERFKVMLDFSNDSLISQLPRKKLLQEEIQNHIESQMDIKSPVGEINLTLTNWDDFACDLIQGTAKLSILRDMNANGLFINREDVVRPKDVKYLYNEWDSHLRDLNDREEILFTAGAVFGGIKSLDQFESFSNSIAFKMLNKILKKGQSGIDSLAPIEVSCLSDSLQDYRPEFTQYQYNVVLDVDKDQSLEQGN